MVPKVERRPGAQRLRLVSTTRMRRDTAVKNDETRVPSSSRSSERRLLGGDFETQLYVAHPELKMQRGGRTIVKAEELAELFPMLNHRRLLDTLWAMSEYLFVRHKGK